MASGDRTSVDRDGVRTTRTGGTLVTAIGAGVVALVVIATAVIVRLLDPRSSAPRADRPPMEATARDAPPIDVAAAEPSHRDAGEVGPNATIPGTIPKTRAGKLRALRALGAQPITRPDGKKDYSTKEVIEALRAAGHHDGIAAFDPPGTNPPKLGLAVPDGYELPEGYIRYFQTTDDGHQLPPVLMFHPDYQFVDENGQPIALPADRIVPPEMAPPGMPLHPIEVPPSGTPSVGRR